jgi:hypothetical protein
MGKLSTIQKRENLNYVEYKGEIGPGGAYHEYEVSYDLYPVGEPVETHLAGKIIFQKGARSEGTSQHGMLDTDLLEIVRHRLQHFQKGEYSTRENALALTALEEALLWLNKRVEDRIEKGILGKNKI